MDHPPREEWVAYLYGECDARAQGRLTAHMRECDECREHVETWRKTMYAMSAWELPPTASRRRARVTPQWAPIAAAAALALFVGVLAARVTAPEPVDVEALRADLTASLREQIGAEWRTALALTGERLYADLYGQLRDDVDTATTRAVLLTRAEAGRAIGAFAQVYEEDQTRSRASLTEVMQQIDDQRARDVADLRITLHSLASATGQEFQRTQRHMNAVTPATRIVPARVTE